MTTKRLQPFSKSDVRYWTGRVFKHVRHTNGRTYTDSNYSVQIAHENRRQFFQLGTANRQEAARAAQRIYQSLKNNGWEQTLATKSLENLSKKTDTRIGEFLAQVRSLHASKVKTIDNYAGSLRKIASGIAGIPSGGRGGASENHRQWRAKVDALKLSILTPSEIQKWRENFLSRAGTDPVKQRSARVSVNSFLREARSLFSPKYLEGLDGVSLPDPLPFTGIKLERRSMPRYQSGFDCLELVKAATLELAESEPEQFKIFVLAVMAGLRRNEIDKLEWARFNWSAGTISIVPTAFFRTKSEDSTRSVWIPPEMLEIFRGYRAKALGRFVIESPVKPTTNKHYDHYRAQATFDKLIGWLRSKGVGGEKPLHTLRKEFGSLIAAKFGIYAAKQMLGHADITTTAAHYLEAKEKPVIGLGHLLPIAPNVIPLKEDEASHEATA
jgi:integrase